MGNLVESVNKLIEFIDNSPSPYQAVKCAAELLESKGFIKLYEMNEWKLVKGEKYYVTKNDSAIAAFIIGTGEIEQEGFRIIGSHTDSPTFKVKPCAEIKVENSYIKLNIEPYGGTILNTWLDRPLSIAGRVSLRSSNPFQPRMELVDIKKSILIIPNLAIHMNREVNNGAALNKQKDMLPLFATITEQLESENLLLKMLAEELQVIPEEILDFDLYLYEVQKGCLVGAKQEMISASRIDNLAMMHAGVYALSKAEPISATNVVVCFDNEEVGSSTKQGADSPFLKNLLERITLSFGKSKEEYYRSTARSFMISADMAHALHPNVVEKHDPTSRPVINKGPVIKISANQTYTSDSESIAVYEMICKEAGVPVQKFVNRSDERGGSTIGPISSTHLDIRSIDIGNPTLAMHSVRELCGVKDHEWIIQSFEKYYSFI